MIKLRIAVVAVSVCLWGQMARTAELHVTGPEGQVSDVDLGKRLDEYAARLSDYGFSGAVLIAKNGRIVLEKGYGRSNFEHHIPVTPDTAFDVGSISKQFTAAAVVKLETEGKLRTDDRISKYLTAVPPDKADITIHQLLTHMSGLPLGPGIWDVVTRDQSVRRILNLTLDNVPGTHYQYSNAGYTLAAAIVEIVSGETFQSYLRHKLFLPAGMTHTGLYGDKIWKTNKLAYNYVDDHDYGAPGDWPANWAIFGAGGIVSSVTDLYKWHLAYEHNVVFSEEAKSKIFKPYVQEEPGGMFYAYGWTVSKTPRGTTLIQHNGGHDRGASAFFRRFIDDGVVVIVLSNKFIAAGDLLGIKMARQLSDIVFGESIPLPPSPTRLSQAVLRSYEGKYSTPNAGEFRVWYDRSRLVIDGENQVALDALSDAPSEELASYPELDRRIASAMEAIRKGDYAEARLGLGQGRSSEQLRTRMTELLDRAKVGRLDSIDVIGTVNNDGDAWTYVRATGNQGSAILRLRWSENGDRIAMMQTAEGGVSPSMLVPVGVGKFASFDFDSRRTTTYDFSSTGSPRHLTIQKASGSVTAIEISNRVRSGGNETGVGVVATPLGKFGIIKRGGCTTLAGSQG